MESPSTTSRDASGGRAVGEAGGRTAAAPGSRVDDAARRSTVESRLVPAFYATLLLSLLGVAVYGDGVHPLLVAALGTGLVFCWLGWPAYCETAAR